MIWLLKQTDTELWQLIQSSHKTTMTLQTVRQNIKNHGIDINDHLLEAVFSRKEIQLLKEDLQSIKDMIRQIKVKQSRSLILDQIYGHLVQSSPLVAMPQNHYKRTIMQKDFDQFLQVQGDMNYKKKLEILKRTQEYIRSGGSLEKAVEYINQKGISLDDELIDKVFDRKEQKLLKQASQQLSVSLSKQSSNEEIPDHSSRSLLISELYPSVKDYSSKSAQPTIQICQLFGILSDALYAQED
ncbi:UNKNOWN [Stylonychia lemnae]|uniref:Uncharacterized protein n=1 Tax=Stylonychia lemnae TaxID=5949 RepID=A0A078AYW1_STYLE|nr:UNKNOWN [Stylonychia lemnae]|eukprot:CDW87321.1 UNKNOWN [Stylonychia lemnae]